jgi:hypothetical protein
MTPVRNAWIFLGVAVGCATPDERSASWSYLHPAIIVPSCATTGCHSKVVSIGANDLSTPTSAYTMLVGKTCDAPDLLGEPPFSFVRPFDPDGSQLVHMLHGVDTLRMPPDVPLPDVEVELIERWILEGATCD